MFKKIATFFQDARIDWDFKSYERECLLDHKRNADRRFSTQNLDNQLADLLKKIEDDADKQFGKVIFEISAREQQLQSNVYSAETMLALFSRNYNNETDNLKEEIAALYTEKTECKNRINELFSELSDAVDSKNAAYAKVNEYAGDVDSWHSKSKRSSSFGGNRGKKIPNHSFFGQSHGDRYSDEYGRDSAYEVAQECKAEIRNISGYIDINKNNLANINNNIGQLKTQIKAAIVDRNRMFELKKAGYSKPKLQRELSELRRVLNQEQNELGKQIRKRTDFITACKYQRGVVELENTIITVLSQKNDFLREFFLPENKIERKRQHRIKWLKQRNL